MSTVTKIFETRRSLSRVFCVIGLPVIIAALVAGAQVSNNSGQFPGGNSRGTMRPTPPQDMDQPVAGNVGNPVFMERRIQQLNAVQHKAMVADTDKLLKLVTELNAEINKANNSTLTAEQLRKVAEIEKLAHSVKDKMRISVRGAPEFEDASPLPSVTRR